MKMVKGSGGRWRVNSRQVQASIKGDVGTVGQEWVSIAHNRVSWTAERAIERPSTALTCESRGPHLECIQSDIRAFLFEL